MKILKSPEFMVIGTVKKKFKGSNWEVTLVPRPQSQMAHVLHECEIIVEMAQQPALGARIRFSEIAASIVEEVEQAI